MSLKKLKDAELNKLLDEVALDLNKAFGDVQTKLAKAEDDKLAKDDGAAGKAPPEESESVTPEGSDAPPPPADASPSPSPSPDAAGAAPAPSGDPAQDMGAELTPEALQAEYQKLPPEELQMHAQALQAAMAAMGGGQPGMDAGAPPAPEAAPAPAMAPPAPAMKSEKTETTLAKSEDLHKAEVDSLKEDVEILAKTLKALIETPVRKAITSIAELPKGEAEEVEEERKALSPVEFWGKLKEVSKRSDLKKSDKQLICDIYERRVQPEVAAKHLAKLFKED